MSFWENKNDIYFNYGINNGSIYLFHIIILIQKKKILWSLIFKVGHWDSKRWCDSSIVIQHMIGRVRTGKNETIGSISHAFKSNSGVRNVAVRKIAIRLDDKHTLKITFQKKMQNFFGWYFLYYCNCSQMYLGILLLEWIRLHFMNSRLLGLGLHKWRVQKTLELETYFN